MWQFSWNEWRVDGKGDPDSSRPADTADAFFRAIVRDTRV